MKPTPSSILPIARVGNCNEGRKLRLLEISHSYRRGDAKRRKRNLDGFASKVASRRICFCGGVFCVPHGLSGTGEDRAKRRRSLPMALVQAPCALLLFKTAADRLFAVPRNLALG